MKLDRAHQIATDIMELMEPGCDRIQIAGSILRRVPDPGDVEIVAIPSQLERRDLLGEVIGRERDPRFVAAVNSMEKVKGDAVAGKYMQRIHSTGIKVDIFTATPINWGYQLAIRTGPAEYSHNVLANGWVRKNFRGEDGNLTHFGSIQPVPEEEDLFELLGLEWTEPWNRKVGT